RGLAGTYGPRDGAVAGADHELVAVGGPEHGIDGPAHAPGVPHDGLEHRLVVRRRGRDRVQYVRRRRLLREGLCQLAILLLQDLARRLLSLQALRQALLELAAPRSFLLRRLADDGEHGFDLRLPALCSPTHRPLL